LNLINDSGAFDVFVTVDKNLPKQQDVRSLSFAIFILRPKSNRFEDVQPLMSELVSCLPKATPGVVIDIGGPA
jgi:hypothetical protein